MNRYTKITNLQLTDSIKIDGFQYKKEQVNKIFQNGLRPNFQYSSLTSYKMNDICMKDGNIYISLKDNNLNNQLTNIEYWKQYFSYQKSIVQWKQNVSYSKNIWVTYQGNLYKSLIDNNTNNIPNEESEYWHKFISGNTVQSINLRGTYNKFALYYKNDVVRNYGALWYCYNDNNGQGIQRQDPPISMDDDSNEYWKLYLVDGLTASVQIGKVQTVEYNIPASITNSGNKYDAIFDFKLPRGYNGKDSYELWLSEGNEGTINDYFNWLRSSVGLYVFRNEDLVDGILTIPYTNSVVGVIDNTGQQWNLPDGSVLKTSSCVYINMLGIMAMKDIKELQGEWNIALSGGVKGDSALSFVVGQINTVSFNEQASVTTTQNQNGLVTFNMNIPRGKDALNLQIGQVKNSQNTNVISKIDQKGNVTLDFQIQKGENSYLYIAYASDNKGSNFSLTPTNELKYRAQLNTNIKKQNLIFEDFKDCVWIKYIGDKGDNGIGKYVYIAYAQDDKGNGFSFQPTNQLFYRAQLHSDFQIKDISQSYFQGIKWIRYIGQKGDKGVINVIYSSEEPVGQFSDGTIWVVI